MSLIISYYKKPNFAIVDIKGFFVSDRFFIAKREDRFCLVPVRKYMGYPEGMVVVENGDSLFSYFERNSNDLVSQCTVNVARVDSFERGSKSCFRMVVSRENTKGEQIWDFRSFEEGDDLGGRTKFYLRMIAP